MNHKVAVTILAGVLLLLMTACSEEDKSPTTLTYLCTDYGGCNGQGADFVLPKMTFDNDTLYWKIHDDLLEIFIGINYICCAPFKIEANQVGDSLKIMIRDTCKAPYQDCYCRCVCYYEFSSIFSNFTGDTYHLSVYLHDPRQSHDSLLWRKTIP